MLMRAIRLWLRVGALLLVTARAGWLGHPRRLIAHRRLVLRVHPDLRQLVLHRDRSTPVVVLVPGDLRLDYPAVVADNEAWEAAHLSQSGVVDCRQRGDPPATVLHFGSVAG